MAQSNVIEMSSSKVGITRMGSRIVLTPRGPVTFQNLDSLKNMFSECMGNKNTEIILDCKAISFMDSETLEFIMQIHEGLKKQRGILKLINVNAICRDIFIVTRLINVFYLYDDIHMAIKSGS